MPVTKRVTLTRAQECVHCHKMLKIGEEVVKQKVARGKVQYFHTDGK